MSEDNGSAGGIARAAHDVLAEMVHAQTEIQRLEKQRVASSTSFDEVLQQKHVRAQKDRVRRVDAARQASLRVGDVIRQAQAAGPGSPSATAVGESERRETSKLATFIQDVVRGQDRMNYIMKLCLSGYNIDPYSLIDLQAAVYKYSQELELTTKVVDNSTSNVKQTFNIQV